MPQPMPSTGQKYHARVWPATNPTGRDPADTKHRRQPSALRSAPPFRSRPARRCSAAAPPAGGAERSTAQPQRHETVLRTPQNQTRNGFASLLHTRAARGKADAAPGDHPPPPDPSRTHAKRAAARGTRPLDPHRGARAAASLFGGPAFRGSRRRRYPDRAATRGAPCGPPSRTPPAPAPLQGHLPPAGRALRALAAALPRHGCAAPPPRAARRGPLGAGPAVAFPWRRRPLAADRSPSRPAEPGALPSRRTSSPFQPSWRTTLPLCFGCGLLTTKNNGERERCKGSAHCFWRRGTVLPVRVPAKFIVLSARQLHFYLKCNNTSSCSF